MDDKVVVRFKTSYMGWNKDTLAGFTPSQAEHLVKIGAGEVVDANAPLQTAPARKGIINRTVIK